MGLRGKGKKPQESGEWRGGCSVHDMHGPARGNPKDAHKDTYGHGKRMHGSKTFDGGYIERRK